MPCSVLFVTFHSPRPITHGENELAVVAREKSSKKLLVGGVTSIVTTAGAELLVPSLATYVKVSIPVMLFVGIYVNPPLALRVSVPRKGPVIRAAAKFVCWLEVSLPRTPGAGTVSVPPRFTKYRSFTAIKIGGNPFTATSSTYIL